MSFLAGCLVLWPRMSGWTALVHHVHAPRETRGSEQHAGQSYAHKVLQPFSLRALQFDIVDLIAQAAHKPVQLCLPHKRFARPLVC